MKVFRTADFGGIGSLRLEEYPNPGPLGPGQVRLAMRAAALNYRDLLAVNGQLRQPVEGLIPCSDGAGVVTETAGDVTGMKVGDRVALTYNPGWIAGPWRANTSTLSRGCPMPGVMQEEIVVHHSEAVIIPHHLSFAEGATLPVAGVTAWHSLCAAVPLMPGMSVLIQGAGGVATFAILFANLFGARVIATSSSDERCERLAAIGADATINYQKNPDWHSQVRELTNGVGVDLSIELGGAKTIDQTIAATRVGGRVALVGLITGWPNQAQSLFTSSVDITPIKVGSRDDFELMNRAIEFHQLKPIIDRHFLFDQLPEALKYLETGKQFGKIVIDF